MLRVLKLDHLVTVIPGAQIDGYLKGEKEPIDFVWSDFASKLKFFDETYDHLQPNGGVLAFHFPSAFMSEIHDIKKRLESEVSNGTCEFITLREPHKIIQMGSFMIRRCRADEQGITSDGLGGEIRKWIEIALTLL